MHGQFGLYGNHHIYPEERCEKRKKYDAICADVAACWWLKSVHASVRADDAIFRFQFFAPRSIPTKHHHYKSTLTPDIARHMVHTYAGYAIEVTCVVYHLSNFLVSKWVYWRIGKKYLQKCMHYGLTTCHSSFLPSHFFYFCPNFRNFQEIKWPFSQKKSICSLWKFICWRIFKKYFLNCLQNGSTRCHILNISIFFFLTKLYQ